MTRKEKLKLKKLDKMIKKKYRKDTLKNQQEFKDFFGLDHKQFINVLKGKY